MVGAVDQGDPDVHGRVPGQHPRGERLLDPGVDRGDVLLGDRPAGDLVDELVAASRPGGLEVDDARARTGPGRRSGGRSGPRSSATGLADGLPVGDLGLAHVGVDAELAQHPVDQDLEVQLAHPRDDRLAGLLVGPDPEGGVLLGQAEQGPGQLVLVGLGLGLDGHVDDRLGEGQGLEHDRVVRVGQGVAGRGLLEADHGDDVAGEDGVLVLAVVGVHLEQPADPLPLGLGRVDDGSPLAQGPRVHPQVGELADVGVGHDLEGQGREGGVVVGGAVLDLAPCSARCPRSGAGRAGSAGSRRRRRASAGRPCS